MNNPHHQPARIAKSGSLCLAALAIAASLSARAAVLIDCFETEQSARVGNGRWCTTVFSSRISGESLGGERDLEVQRLSGKKGPVEAAAAVPDDGLFSLNTGFGAFGRAMITWDGADASRHINYSGLSGFDLTQGGVNQQFFLSGAADLGASVRIRVYESAARYSEGLLSIAADTDGILDDYAILFSEFTSVGGGARFDHVGAITLELFGRRPGADAALGCFGVGPEDLVPIPEADTGWVAGFLLVFACATGWLRWRHSKSRMRKPASSLCDAGIAHG